MKMKSCLLADYMYAVASYLPVIDYIPEWLVVMDDEEEVLNTGMSNLSLDLIEEDINHEERERQRQEFELNEAIRLEQELILPKHIYI